MAGAAFVRDRHVGIFDLTCVLLLLGLSVLLLCAAASADELLMKDGSRLLGKVVKKENGILEFETAFAGVIQVQWAQVVELHAVVPYGQVP